MAVQVKSDLIKMRGKYQEARRAALEEALRAEAAESEKRLCLQFAEEATAFKVQADISLQKAEARTRAAARAIDILVACGGGALPGIARTD